MRGIAKCLDFGVGGLGHGRAHESSECAGEPWKRFASFHGVRLHLALGSSYVKLVLPGDVCLAGECSP